MARDRTDRSLVLVSGDPSKGMKSRQLCSGGIDSAYWVHVVHGQQEDVGKAGRQYINGGLLADLDIQE